MTKEMILGILIPFAGTSLGAGCVFLMRDQLRLGVNITVIHTAVKRNNGSFHPKFPKNSSCFTVHNFSLFFSQ